EVDARRRRPRCTARGWIARALLGAPYRTPPATRARRLLRQVAIALPAATVECHGPSMGITSACPPRPRRTCCVQVCPELSTNTRHNRSQHTYIHPYDYLVAPLSPWCQCARLPAEMQARS